MGEHLPGSILKFFKDLYWTTSRQAPKQVWLVHKPGRRAVYSFSNRNTNDYPLQYTLDFGDLVNKFCDSFNTKTLDEVHIGTKTQGGAAYECKDVIDQICDHIFGERFLHSLFGLPFSKIFNACETASTTCSPADPPTSDPNMYPSRSQMMVRLGITFGIS